MYLIVVAWLYVALMMAVAEANHANGTLLGALFTFVLYGAAPVALVLYFILRGSRRRAREAAELPRSSPPDGGGEAPADAVPPVRKEP